MACLERRVFWSIQRYAQPGLLLRWPLMLSPRMAACLRIPSDKEERTIQPWKFWILNETWSSPTSCRRDSVLDLLLHQTDAVSTTHIANYTTRVLTIVRSSGMASAQIGHRTRKSSSPEKSRTYLSGFFARLKRIYWPSLCSPIESYLTRRSICRRCRMDQITRILCCKTSRAALYLSSCTDSYSPTRITEPQTSSWYISMLFRLIPHAVATLCPKPTSEFSSSLCQGTKSS